MDPFTAYLIGQGISGIGGAISSGQQNKMTKQQMIEQAREFNAQQNFTQEMGRTANQFGQVKNINELQRQMETAPLRDKTLYMLNQRMGMVPQTFNPRDMMNPQSSGNQTQSQGGIDPAKLQAAMQTYQAPDFTGGTYKAGSGGVDPRMYGQLLSRLGVSGPVGQATVGDVPLSGSPVQGGPWDPPKQQNAGGQPTGGRVAGVINGWGSTPGAQGGQPPSGGGTGGGWGSTPGSQGLLPNQIQPSFDYQRGPFRPLTMGRGY